MFARRASGRTNRRGIPGSKSGVTPLTIIKSVPVLQWIRADRGITIGTGVSAWADQSGNNNNFSQATGSFQPAYNAADATLSNLATVTGDGVNDLLNDTMSLNPAQEIFMSGIVKVITWATSKAVWGSNGVPEGMELAAYTGFSNPQLGQYNGVIANPTGGLPLSTWGRAEQVQSTTASYTKLNSFLVNSTLNTGSNVVTGTQLFGTTGAAWMNAGIAERVVTRGVPTPAEKAALDAYYVARYGLEIVYGNPLSIFGSANVLQWVRADRGITLGTGVSAWADQTANANNYSQATGGKQPVYNTVDPTLGNKPTITFDGVDDTLIDAGFTLPAPGTTPASALSVLKIVAESTNGAPYGDASAGGVISLIQGGAGAHQLRAQCGAVGATTTFSAGQWMRTHSDFTGGASDVSRTGSSQSTGLAGNATASGRAIGSVGTGLFCNCAVFELVYLNFIPSAAQLAAYDAYVNAITGGTVAL